MEGLMADTAAPTEAAEAAAGDGKAKSRGKLPLILAVVAAPLIGGGLFYAIHSGMLFAPAPSGPSLPDTGSANFVAIAPMIISLGPSAGGRHLRFAAQVEVVRGQTSAVQALMPRIADVLNSYLRAVDFSDLEEPAALLRLRAQMLRRLQVIAGEGRITDLLITEFVLN
jgi:flagellar protein FliL